MDNPTHLLLVEDNEGHVELIRRAFESHANNYLIHVVSNLHDARKTLKNSTIDLIITDLKLPDGQGLELIHTLHKKNKYPIILMTSFGDEYIAVEAMKLGVNDYIVKTPEAFDAMPQTVGRTLRDWANIIEKQHAQQDLHDKEQEQSEILNNILDGVMTVDHSGVILSCNKSAEKLFGYHKEEIIGLNINLIIVQTDTHKNIQHYFIIDNDKTKGLHQELTAKRKDDSTFLLSLSVVELPKRKSEKPRFIVSCHDLTDIKVHEELLRRSQKMDALGKLTGGIAHDYNNILGIILGYAELLHPYRHDANKIKEYSDSIIHAAERGAKLVKKLLAFSRYKKPDLSMVDINRLLRDQQHMLEKTLTAKHKLSLDLVDDIWLVELDEGDLEDAIINMCINAMHAMNVGGQLTISTSKEQLNEFDVHDLGLKAGNYLLLSIADTGCGMDSDTREKIFDLFYTTKGELGTGLGLSQVYGFVERSGGFIKVYSDPGHGSRFSLYFPRSMQPIVTGQNTVMDPALDLNGDESILVVDDEQDMAELNRQLLMAHGYRVLTANDGIQALRILENERIDLIVSDVIMPNMDGFQLAIQVRKLYPKIKLQLLSGYTDNHDKGMVVQALQKNMLNKPYTSKTLLSRIRILLDQSESLSV